MSFKQKRGFAIHEREKVHPLWMIKSLYIAGGG